MTFLKLFRCGEYMSLKNVNNRLVREYFSDNQTKTVFQDNQLSGFDALWTLDAPWFEPPNERRDGISGVVTWNILGPNGENWPIFIKRQQNHNTRTLAHPIKGVPTFYREQKNISRLIEIGVPTLDILYYGEQATPEGTKAILVSRALEDYVSLEDWFDSPVKKDELMVSTVLKRVVDAIKPMHQHGIRHGCLYGKHVFLKFFSDDVKSEEGKPEVDVRLIDLEKAHFSFFKNNSVLKDLSQLIRYSGPAFQSQASHLLSLYFGAEKQQLWLSRLAKHMRKRLR